MIGYWVPEGPIKTDHSRVLSTTYLNKGAALISIASWEKENVLVDLKIDWQKLGIDKDSASIKAPAIEGFQDEAEFKIGQPLPVASGKGWLLIISESK